MSGCCLMMTSDAHWVSGPRSLVCRHRPDSRSSTWARICPRRRPSSSWRSTIALARSDCTLRCGRHSQTSVLTSTANRMILCLACLTQWLFVCLVCRISPVCSLDEILCLIKLTLYKYHVSLHSCTHGHQWIWSHACVCTIVIVCGKSWIWIQKCHCGIRFYDDLHSNIRVIHSGHTLIKLNVNHQNQHYYWNWNYNTTTTGRWCMEGGSGIK